MDPTEINLIRDAFNLKIRKNNLTEEQSNMLNDFRKWRSKYAQMPFHLSPRSDHHNYPRKMRRNDKNAANEGRSCFLDCLACFACLCD